MPQRFNNGWPSQEAQREIQSSQPESKIPKSPMGASS